MKSIEHGDFGRARLKVLPDDCPKSKRKSKKMVYFEIIRNWTPEVFERACTCIIMSNWSSFFFKN